MGIVSSAGSYPQLPVMRRSCTVCPGPAASCCSARRCALPESVNDIDEDVILTTFAHWRVEHMPRTTIPSDTRTLEVLLVRLTAWTLLAADPRHRAS